MIKTGALSFLIGYFIIMMPYFYATNGTFLEGLVLASIGILILLIFNKLGREGEI